MKNEVHKQRSKEGNLLENRGANISTYIGQTYDFSPTPAFLCSPFLMTINHSLGFADFIEGRKLEDSRKAEGITIAATTRIRDSPVSSPKALIRFVTIVFISI